MTKEDFVNALADAVSATGSIINDCSESINEIQGVEAKFDLDSCTIQETKKSNQNVLNHDLEYLLNMKIEMNDLNEQFGAMGLKKEMEKIKNDIDLLYFHLSEMDHELYINI